jgi:hypothetical protein
VSRVDLLAGAYNDHFRVGVYLIQTMCAFGGSGSPPPPLVYICTLRVLCLRIYLGLTKERIISTEYIIRNVESTRCSKPGS